MSGVTRSRPTTALGEARRARRQAVARLRAERLSTRAIAQVLGTSHNTVRRDLRLGAIESPDWIEGRNGRAYASTPTVAPRRLPVPPARELRRLYVDEMRTTIEVGAAFGVNHGTAARWIREAGIPLRPRGVGRGKGERT
jgi:IS30 family transposase